MCPSEPGSGTVAIVAQVGWGAEAGRSGGLGLMVAIYA